ncbi:VWA domain-containing protein [Geomonas sp. RF6]|uniref:VWA domain-containing protein n=1 Tax=Geomonas sp. RF6 TaxID=2897342 RepID=UPI001E3E5DB1|nr:VWA domain-containing protein [Geomonas sp. RF6]UFS69551.1 VWA domain-containing protein [Geomonas sp. RF6]
MRFHDPHILFILLLLFPLTLLLRHRAKNAEAFPLPAALSGEHLPQTVRSRLARVLPYLRLLPLALAIVALARPQGIEREGKVRTEGVDLVVALDLSSSMLAQDLSGRGMGENRLVMAKKVVTDFIRGRAGDRIALVAFAARAYPAAPLTLDHEWLQRAVGRLDTASVEDGTALGDGIACALNRFRNAGTRSRAVIVVTDGRSNAGSVSPREAAAAAKALGIRVHTVGMGAKGAVVIPVPSPLGGTTYTEIDADLDESTLREVAAGSGGSFFRADDSRVLRRVFAEIDRLEKRPVEEKVFFSYSEWFPPLLVAALALLCLEVSLKCTVLRRVL